MPLSLKKINLFPLNLFGLIVFFSLFLMPQMLLAASVTLTWDRNQEPDIAGYKIFYGTSSHNYTDSTTINDTATSPPQISHTIDGLSEGMTYYFAVKAFDLAGQYSDFSSEISAAIPSSGGDPGGSDDDGGDSGGDGEGGGDSAPMEFKVNFQPGYSPVPDGYAVDSGRGFNGGTGYGWNRTVRVYDYNRTGDQLKDTVAKVYGNRKWEIAVPDGEYEVTVCIGNPKWYASNQNVQVEGASLFSRARTSKGRWLEKKIAVTVNDGRLTLTFAGSRKVYLDYVIIRSNGTPDWGNLAPVARLSASQTSGTVPFTVELDASASEDPDGSIVSYDWDFGDGETGIGPIISHEFIAAGQYNIKLTVTDAEGAVDTKEIEITATDPSVGDDEGGGDDDGEGGGDSAPMEFKVNFQPGYSPVPDGYAVDSGRGFNGGTGYGWNRTVRVYDYNRTGDQLKDTVAKVYGNRKWEIAVPDGEYEVTVCIGNPKWYASNQNVQVEGASLFSRARTSKGRWLEKKIAVTVNDGRLTLTFAGSRKVYLDYVIIRSNGTPGGGI